MFIRCSSLRVSCSYLRPSGLSQSNRQLRVRIMASSSESGSSGSSTTKKLVLTLLSGEQTLSLYEAKGETTTPIKFLDGSWHLGGTRDAIREFTEARLPGARYFNIDEACDKSNPLPHMLPTPEHFTEYVRNLGIGANDHVVVYTHKDCFSAARVWWTFRIFGFPKVSVLNGGIGSWKGPLESGSPPPPAPTTPPTPAFTASLQADTVATWQQVLDIVNKGHAQIADARSNARFHAQVPEPRPGLEGGHIPGSLNLPFQSLLKEGDPTTFKDPENIRDELLNAGIVFGTKQVLSCGSGVTAAVIALSLDLMGKELSTCPIYDGSWSEWGARADLPKCK